MEQVILAKHQRFGRSSEKLEDASQICFLEVDGNIVFFNEAEAVCDLGAAEPEELEIPTAKRPKRKGKKMQIFPNLRSNGLITICRRKNWRPSLGQMDGKNFRTRFRKDTCLFRRKFRWRNITSVYMQVKRMVIW